MARIGSFYYWFNNKGPTQGAFVKADGSTVEVDFTRYSDTTKIRDVKADEVIALGLAGPGDKGWTGQYDGAPRPDGSVPTHYVVESFPTLEEFVQHVLAERQAAFATEGALTPVEKLERELKSHDWYCAYSDTPGVCGAGERHFRQIDQMMREVSEEDARRLWTQYAPAGFLCPLDPLPEWDDEHDQAPV